MGKTLGSTEGLEDAQLQLEFMKPSITMEELKVVIATKGMRDFVAWLDDLNQHVVKQIAKDFK